MSQYVFQHCLLCRDRPANSDAHVIPKSLQGRLAIRALCRECNSFMGSRYEGVIPRDIKIRQAAEACAQWAPTLDRRLNEGKEYEAITPGQTVRLIRKKGQLAPKTVKVDPHTITTSDDRAPDILSGMLAKDGLDKDQIRVALAALADHPKDGSVLQLTAETGVRRDTGTYDAVFPTLELSDERAWVGIALLGLATLIGEGAGDWAARKKISEWLLTEDASRPAVVTLSRGSSPQPNNSAEHCLRFEQVSETAVVVRIGFFGGRVIVDVRFDELHISRLEPITYCVDPETGEELVVGTPCGGK